MSDQDKKQNPFINRNPLETYRKTEVNTANPETILLMMYAGAMRFIKKAIDAAEKGDIAERGRQIAKTQEIVTELRSTLNFEVGGEIARTLELLYAYISQRLGQAGLENNIDHLKEVLGILTTLNEGWEQAVANIRKDRAKTPTLEK